MLDIFKLKKRQEEGHYIYLEPSGEEFKFEILDHDGLWERYENGSLVEGCRLFKVEREIKVSFERVIHLD